MTAYPTSSSSNRSPWWGLLAISLALLGCGETTMAEPGPDASTEDLGSPDKDRTPDADTLADLGEPDDAEAPADSEPADDTGEPLDAALDAPVALDVPVAFDAPVALDVPVSMDVPPPPRDVGPPPRDVPPPPRDVPPPPRDVPAPSPPQTGLLLDGTRPLACADPALFSAANAEGTYYAYCTGMAHVWVTSDWARFDDRRSATRFDLTGMSANGREIGSWWAPGIVWAPDLRQYVMWVSVPDARGRRGASGWDTRSLAVLTSATPTGPWIYRGLGLAASATGQHLIDPFLFRDHDGRRYVFFKRYGGGASSSIMGAAVDASWRHLVAGSQVEIMDGYGGPGTWEDNVRENPAVDYDPATGHHHMLFSGGHWSDDSYATGHALSTCGPLCVRAPGRWRIVSSGDRGIVQVVRARGDADFRRGGPGGAIFQDDRARTIVYAAAARSARGDSTRYLMRQAIRWSNDAPYVDTPGHRPELR